MVGQTSSYQGAVQRIAGTNVSQTLVNVGTTTPALYTVPAGKKAVINALSDKFVAYGANGSMKLTIAGVIVRSNTLVETSYTIEPVAGQILTAGQTIIYQGDNAANNGTINVFLSYTELPA